MPEINLIQIAYAQEAEGHTGSSTETAVPVEEKAHESSGGIEIQFSTVAFQALNFLLLIFVLHKILYKPLLEIVKKREKKIQDGIENADKAEQMVQESGRIRQDMIKTAHAESQEIMEKARKSGEEIRSGIVDEAHKEASNIVHAGHSQVEMEKAKTAQEIKEKAADMIVTATEKVLRQKLDSDKDLQLVKESLNSYSA
jgi:F-type H+-transporting ATPase subunit b